MSAIGPGDWVQAVQTKRRIFYGAIFEGALYQIDHLEHDPATCITCRKPGWRVSLVGQPPGRSPWCSCGFRLWPPPPSDALRSEETPADEQVLA